MTDRGMPTADQLRELLNYDAGTGILTWRERGPEMFGDRPQVATKSGARTAEWSARIWNSQNAGKEAFLANNGVGYRTGRVFKKSYLAHRVAWAIHYGAWPTGHIDHINGDRSDNRIANLRDVSRSENQQNQKLPGTNKTGCCGVTKRGPSWRAEITCRGKYYFLGAFPDKQAAIDARKKAERELGFHPNHGRPDRGEHA